MSQRRIARSRMPGSIRICHPQGYHPLELMESQNKLGFSHFHGSHSDVGDKYRIPAKALSYNSANLLKPMTASKDELMAVVEFLTSIYPYRNYQHVDSLNRAAAHIEEQLGQAGYATSRQSWTARERRYHNIIASYQPEKERRLILGAHYDVFGDQPGADDNASGVAGLLETARLILQSNPAIAHRIDFVAYSLEEPPFFGKKEMGSFIHARSLYEEGADVIGMVSYEMIGYYTGTPVGPKHFPPGTIVEIPDSLKFIGVISTHQYAVFHRRFYELMKRSRPMRTAFVSFPDGSRGPSLSDNRNYWHFGYPALMLNSGPSSGKNPHYHQTTDTMDKLNFDVMAEVVTAIAMAAVGMDDE